MADMTPERCIENLPFYFHQNLFQNKFEVPYSDIPYISKKIHYAEKNPEFKDTWRGRNNASNTMVPALQDQIGFKPFNFLRIALFFRYY